MGSSADPVPVAVALGSNLGDRASHLRAAIAAITPFLQDLKVSTFIDTAPVGVGDQPRFLNGVAVGTTHLSPSQLLQALLDAEAALGRTRPSPGAARTVDLDLILYGDRVIAAPDLVVPHPRFREREFVLAPLAEVAGDWVDPVTGSSARELLLAVRSRGNRTPKRVLVLGGSYFIGRTLVERLQADGHDVSVLNRGSRVVPGVGQLVANRDRPDEMARALTGASFDWVMDMSCYTAEQAAGARTALGGRFGTWLYLSTAAVYPGGSDVPFSEDDVGPGREWEEYGWNKLGAERELVHQADAGQQLVIVRPPYVYGPLNTLPREKWLWARMLQGRHIWMPRQGSTRLHFVHVADLVDAMVLTTSRATAPVSIFNVAQRETPTILEYLTLLGEIAGVAPRLYEVDSAALEIDPRSFFPFRDFQCLLNTDLLAHSAGWRARYDMREGLTHTLATLDPDALRAADVELAVEGRLLASIGDG
ncbi:MAG: 2-amino-4-hydroxy-6-hydroxymethyldihydropteridine diphosphokinase [Vicinamibacterales bacterium]